MINVSSGTAIVLSLSEAFIDASPTTAYLLVGERCERDCSFCTQARSSRAPAQVLSRVIWPPYEEKKTLSALKEAYESAKIQRACLQVTVSPGYLSRTEEIIAQLKGIPICASVVVSNLDQVARLFDSGLEIAGLSLDAATEEVYRHVKDGSFNRALGLIEEAAKRFPGRIATHLIVGLGETEEEMVWLIQRLHDWGVIVALFAFTPNPGTALEDHPAPPLSSYRRIQIARHLIVEGLARADEFVFPSGSCKDSPEGRILGFGLEEHELSDALRDGQAFQTSGCPDCNRPYYNERPGGALYNYPRPLNATEIRQAMREADLPLTKGQKERIIKMRGGG
jgi:biotin synthase-related radical SAM superfamily protein